MPRLKLTKRHPEKPDMKHRTFEDGTYSNTFDTKEEVPREASWSVKLKEYDEILMEDGTRWQVLQLLDWGVALASWPRKTMPGMHNAVMFAWGDLDNQKIRKL